MTLPPDDLPRSRSGRVPQWVVDEAARRATESTSWRTTDAPHTHAPIDFTAPDHGAPAGGYRHRPRRRAFRTRSLIAPVLVLSMLAALMWAQLDSADLTLADVFHPPEIVAGDAAARGPQRMEDFPPEGVGESGAPLSTPPSIEVASTSYAFISSAPRPDGSVGPVSWSPCRPINVVLNPDRAPEGFSETLTAALAEVSALTGLVLVLEGETDEPPQTDRAPYQPERYGERWAPVLVGFASEDDDSALAGTVAGVASTVPIGRSDGSAPVIMSGSVLLDVTTKSRGWFSPPAVYEEVLLHELAHLVGLDHVDDPAQLMYPQLKQTSFQAGDRTGLAQLGTGRCAPDL